MSEGEIRFSDRLRERFADQILGVIDSVDVPTIEVKTECWLDVARALQFFFTSTPYARVDRIYLIGGACVVPGLCESIAERMPGEREIFGAFFDKYGRT